MFIAVVFKYHYDTHPDSHKDHGGWESFLANTKDEAVQKAITAATRWEIQPKTTTAYDSMGRSVESKAKYYGPYQILVGEVNEEAVRNNYTIKPSSID